MARYEPPPHFQPSENKTMNEDQNEVETFLIRVPRKFDISRLNGVEYTPGEITTLPEIKEEDSAQITSTYQLAASSGPDLDVSPLVQRGSEVAVGRPIDHFLSVSKSYEIDCKPSSYALPGSSHLRKQPVPMPEGLSQRFVPFGAGQPVSKSHSSKSHKGKKRKRAKDSTSEEIPSEKKSKKKKKKERINGEL